MQGSAITSSYKIDIFKDIELIFSWTWGIIDLYIVLKLQIDRMINVQVRGWNAEKSPRGEELTFPCIKVFAMQSAAITSSCIQFHRYRDNSISNRRQNSSL